MSVNLGFKKIEGKGIEHSRKFVACYENRREKKWKGNQNCIWMSMKEK